jgi:two-component system, response regulator PdtaR
MKKIVLIEDERILAMTLKFELARKGYTVLATAGSGAEAIAAVREHAPEILIMDISINGEMTGIDAANAISEFARTPVVFLTGESDADTRTRALATPHARGYLTKPMNIIELEAVLQSIALEFAPLQ